jgi:hypothetical protein
MDELAPILCGLILGALIWCIPSRSLRLALSIAAVVASGVAATLFSGEYRVSWLYLLLDLGEASVAFGVGAAVMRLVVRKTARGATQPGKP